MRVRLLVILSAVLVCSAHALAAAAATCDSVAACVLGTNSMSGPGVAGSSSSGFGITGSTKANATSLGTARAGVYGEDASTNKNAYDSGVAGTSTFGFGVSGRALSGVGVSGVGLTGGEFVTLSNGNALESIAAQGTGATLSGYITGAALNSYEQGLSAQSYLGPGIVASGGIGYFEGGDGVDAASQDTALHAFANDGPVHSTVGNANVLLGTKLVGTSDGGAQIATDVVSIDSNGNGVFAGTLSSRGTPLFRTTNASGKDVATFGARATTATIEDMGGASLDRGTAYVPLDPAFATIVDGRTKYLVFLTPQGDSRGLYATQITAKGFSVRENGGGRSSLAFDYRIVAKPLDASAARLPAAETARLRAPIRIPDFAKMRAGLQKALHIPR